MIDLILKNKVGVDIGGSLTKLVYFTCDDKSEEEEFEITEAELEGRKIEIYMKKWDSTEKGVRSMISFLKGTHFNIRKATY